MDKKPEMTLSRFEVNKENLKVFLKMLDAIDAFGQTQKEEMSLTPEYGTFIGLKLSIKKSGNCHKGMRRVFAEWLHDQLKTHSNNKK